MWAHDPRSAQDMSTCHNLCSPDQQVMVRLLRSNMITERICLLHIRYSWFVPQIYIFYVFFLIWFVTFALAIWLLRMRDIFAILGTWTFSIMLMAMGSQWKSHNFKVFKLYSISQVDICHTSWPIPVHIFCIDNLQFLDFWCLMCYCPIRIIYIWSVLQSTAHVTRLPRTWSSMLSLNWKKLQSRKNEMVDM